MLRDEGTSAEGRGSSAEVEKRVPVLGEENPSSDRRKLH